MRQPAAGSARCQPSDHHLPPVQQSVDPTPGELVVHQRVADQLVSVFARLHQASFPYRRGDLVLPELASAYLDRDRVRPGMIRPGDVVTTAFAAIGWTWGGSCRTTRSSVWDGAS